MKNNQMREIIKLQLIIIIYTISGIMAKVASMKDNLLWVGTFFVLDFLFLAVYAVFWQQMIKKFPLSVAYANRAMALLWSAIWARMIFEESITMKQVMAIGFVILGTILVNWEGER